MGSIRPRSPLLKPLFAIKLLINAALSWFQSIPAHIPYHMLVAGPEDHYTDSEGLIRWAKMQKKKFGADISVLSFHDGFHDLANEPGYIGELARQHSATFLRSHVAITAGGGRCAFFGF